MVALTYNFSVWEAKAGRQQVYNQLGLQSEFQLRQEYTEKLSESTDA